MNACADKIYHTIPKVDKILLLPEVALMQVSCSRMLVLEAVRSVLEVLRRSAKNGRLAVPLREEKLCALIRQELDQLTSHRLHPVVNGTGIVLHTNLGRAPLAGAAIRHLCVIAGSYSNLEMDVASGERGERSGHVEELLCRLTGAEAALVVNNNAAAVLLVLSGLAAGREAIVSRGELVEIGGGFRIPDVMKQSGSRLVEVGTTNRTHLRDYVAAISPDTALLMKVHSSNFMMRGYTADVPIPDLVKLGKEKGIPVMADIGSGCMIDLALNGIPGEIPLSQYISDGVDIVTCSGDKLLGGPQAGIILGRRDVLTRLRHHPLLRAVRIDKLTLAALEATLLLYQDERTALSEIPALQMLTATAAELQKKGRDFLRRLRRNVPAAVSLQVIRGTSLAGGGSLPLLELPSCLIAVAVTGRSAREIDETCRRSKVPVIGRISRERYLLDLRTVQECDLDALAAALSALTSPGDGEE